MHRQKQGLLAENCLLSDEWDNFPSAFHPKTTSRCLSPPGATEKFGSRRRSGVTSSSSVRTVRLRALLPASTWHTLSALIGCSASPSRTNHTQDRLQWFGGLDTHFHINRSTVIPQVRNKTVHTVTQACYEGNNRLNILQGLQFVLVQTLLGTQFIEGPLKCIVH